MPQSKKAASNEERLAQSLNSDDKARNGEPSGNSAAIIALAGGRNGCRQGGSANGHGEDNRRGERSIVLWFGPVDRPPSTVRYAIDREIIPEKGGGHTPAPCLIMY